jgi:hypothetical protein
VKIISLGMRSWGDAGLGCPKPGHVYLSTITPGLIVLLRIENERFEYHTDLNGRVELCKQLGSSDRR